MMDDLARRDARLDDLLRPALLVEPPPEVQQALLAAVLSVAPAPVPAARPSMITRPAHSVTLLTYALLAAATLAYVGLLTWFQGLFEGSSWIVALARSLVSTADLYFGQPLASDPLGLVAAALKVAPWLVLLPIALLLWQRDRAAAQAR
jgi:hypothetical protein